MKQNLDCLFLHTGARSRGGYIFGIIPAGLPPLAAALERAGFSARILNLACLRPGEPGLAGTIKRLKPRLFCLSLHWHVQAAEVLRLAASLKRDHPSAQVILGGLTATFFARQILDSFPAVDYIIRGDAETAMPLLAQALLKGGPGLDRVPNLAWRRGRRLALNSLSSRTHPRKVPAHEGMELILNRDSRPGTGHCFEEGAFTYVHARGCSENCAACGGGRDFNRRFAGRTAPEVKSPSAAAAELRNLMRTGITRFYFPANPVPGDGFYLSLLSELRKMKLAPELRIDYCCGLPGPRLLRRLAALSPRPEATFFTGSGSERIRRRTRGRYYSNKALLLTMGLCRELGIKARACFSAGFPGENNADVEQTASLMTRINTLSGCNACNVYVFPVEPGSPVFLRPAKYGITLRRRNLRGFIGQKAKYDLGYATSRMSEKDIVRAIKRLEKVRLEGTRP